LAALALQPQARTLGLSRSFAHSARGSNIKPAVAQPLPGVVGSASGGTLDESVAAIPLRAQQVQPAAMSVQPIDLKSQER
jgi:hypothetical protein